MTPSLHVDQLQNFALDRGTLSKKKTFMSFTKA